MHRKGYPCAPVSHEYSYTRLKSPDDATAEDLSKLAWAIAHPARIRIVRLLLMKKSCVCGEIVEEMPLAQSTVSQHLKILKESGLIEGEIDGPRFATASISPL